MPPARGIVVVANRLPVQRVARRGEWEVSPGGLVSALSRAIAGRDAHWVGWTGTTDYQGAPFDHDGVMQHPVPLSASDIDAYYNGFSNAALWPLYHGALRPAEYRREWWQRYVEVNRRFAEHAAEATRRGGTVWVHDYQLQLVPGFIRELRPDVRVGFFLHIPFPPLELFAQLPWRRQVLAGILGADLVGFQTQLSAANFSRAAKQYGGGRTVAGAVEVDSRRVRVGAYPITIDVCHFVSLAQSSEVRWKAKELRESINHERRVILGVDRLDYTKGVSLRLQAFEHLLSRRPELAAEVVLLQVAVPSRERVSQYQAMRNRIEQLVGRINGTYGVPGRFPVHYLYRSLDAPDLVAAYTVADVMAVTPLADGMNLVAKEYVACRLADDGVLVLSEFAGAAAELRRAILVNPHDVDMMSDAFETALEMPQAEQKRRMQSLRRAVTRHDVHHWASRFLEALG